MIELDKKVLEEAAILNEIWAKFAPHDLAITWIPSSSVWDFGGYNATRAACGLPPDNGDLDFFLRDPAQLPVNMGFARKKIGNYMHGKICEQYNIQKQYIKINTMPDGAFFNFKILNSDYTIGSRKIYSNFQVSIDLKTAEIQYDTVNHPTHQQDFEKYKLNHDIITYDFETLIQGALNLSADNRVGFSVLSWVIKSYIKPIKNDKKHFSQETAQAILGIKKNHRTLYNALRQNCMAFYSIPEEDFDLVFDTALETKVNAEKNLEAKKVVQALSAAHELAMAQQEAEKVMLIDELNQRKSEISSLQEQSQNDKIEMERLKRIVTSKESRIDELNKKVDSQNKEINLVEKLKAEKKTIRQELSQEQQKNQEQALSIKELTKKNEALMNKIENLELEMVKLEKEKAQIGQVKDEFKEKNAQLGVRYKELDTLAQERILAQKLAVFLKAKRNLKNGEHLFKPEAIDLSTDVPQAQVPLLRMAATLFEDSIHDAELFIELYFLLRVFYPNSTSSSQTAVRPQDLQAIFLDMDYQVCLYYGQKLTPVERYKVIARVLNTTTLFMATEYFQADNPLGFSCSGARFRVGLTEITQLSPNAVPEALKPGQEYFEALILCIDKNAQHFIHYAKNQILTPQLIKAIDDLLAIKSCPSIGEYRSTYTARAMGLLYVKCKIHLDHYKKMIAAYMENQRTRAIEWRKSTFSNLYAEYFSSRKGDTEAIKIQRTSIANRRAFINAYFKAVHEEYKDEKFEWLIHGFFMDVKSRLKQETVEAWMSHPLIEAFSLVLSHKNVSDLINPRFRGTLLTKGLAELKDSPLFLEKLLSQDPYTARNVLAVIINVLTAFLPQNPAKLHVFEAYSSMCIELRAYSESTLKMFRPIYEDETQAKPAIPAIEETRTELGHQHSCTE